MIIIRSLLWYNQLSTYDMHVYRFMLSTLIRPPSVLQLERPNRPGGGVANVFTRSKYQWSLVVLKKLLVELLYLSGLLVGDSYIAP